MSDIKAACYMAVNLILGFFGWINWTVIEGWLKILSLLVSIIVGLFAIRFYNSGHKKNKTEAK